MQRIDAALQNISQTAIAAKAAERKASPDLWMLVEELKRYVVREVIVEMRPAEPSESESGIPDFLDRLHPNTADGKSVH